jgi:beta-lactamase superfamily II metal-dependent hydrolase
MSINNPTDQVNEQVIMTCNNQIENNVEQNQLVESAEYSLVSVKSGDTIEDIQVLAVANSDVQSVIEGDLKVHYIDVGQADSILIQQNGYNMLIDGGNNEDSDLVINYLKQQGVTKLDYVIGTHPHEDHIGGLDVAIKSFDIGKVILPKVTSTTQTFEDVVNAIADKGLKIITPVVGDTYELGSAQWTIVAPNSSSYDDLNNYSIVIKLKFGNNSFIFTGDAEDVSEGEILAKQLDIQGDVLKIGHHGSNSSTTTEFLEKVNPSYAVISVGADNKYGHPYQETMDKLKNKGIEVYRTDECGTIVCTSDGNNITFNTDPGDYSYSNTESNNITESNTIIENSTGQVKISALDKKAEVITITNSSSSDVDMTGWIIKSVTGEQTFVFPEYVLKCGTSVNVGGYDSADICNFQWEQGNGVWNNSKSDPAELYDSKGVLVSRFDD